MHAPVALLVCALWAFLHLGLAVGHLLGLGVAPWVDAESSALHGLAPAAVARLVGVLAVLVLAALGVALPGSPTRARTASWVLLAVGALTTLVVADVRSLTLLGYLPMVVLALLGVEPFASQAVGIPGPSLLSISHSVGGLGLLLTGLAMHARLRPLLPAATRRLGRWSVGVAVAVPLVYASTRVAWALGIPLGIRREFLIELGDAKYAGLGLGLFAILGALLTLGLVQRWGERFWSWLPLIGGRPVPVSLAVVPALFVAMSVVSAGISFARIILGGSLERLPGEPADWGAWAPELLWIPWGIALGVAALAYRARRQGWEEPRMRD